MPMLKAIRGCMSDCWSRSKTGGKMCMRGIRIGVTVGMGDAFLPDNVQTSAVPGLVQASQCPGREARAMSLAVSVPGIALPALLCSSCMTAERQRARSPRHLTQLLTKGDRLYSLRITG